MSERRAVFSSGFLEDLEQWVRTDRKIALKLVRLVTHTLRDSLDGPGNPEPPRRQLSDLWSRRLTQEHRLVCTVTKSGVRFLQRRYHYE